MKIASYANPDLPKWRMAPGVTRPTLFYRVMRTGCRVFMPGVWKIRVFNRHYEPATGGVVYISNHQSFLDPMLVGFGLQRPLSYMARDTLFKQAAFRRLITSVNAFPVKRGTADVGALKEAMRRIKGGGGVLLFAEGTRTLDGHIGPLLPGMAMLAQRAAQWTVPVVIDGAYECWPRTQKLPSTGSIVVQYGPPISQDEARQHDPQDFVNIVRAQMIEIQTDIRRRVGRPELKYEEEPHDAI
jgi:1-acyl-sn-glycerol-3-phosphate acyltransferase